MKSFIIKTSVITLLSISAICFALSSNKSDKILYRTNQDKVYLNKIVMYNNDGKDCLYIDVYRFSTYYNNNDEVERSVRVLNCSFAELKIDNTNSTNIDTDALIKIDNLNIYFSVNNDSKVIIDKQSSTITNSSVNSNYIKYYNYRTNKAVAYYDYSVID